MLSRFANSTQKAVCSVSDIGCRSSIFQKINLSLLNKDSFGTVKVSPNSSKKSRPGTDRKVKEEEGGTGSEMTSLCDDWR